MKEKLNSIKTRISKTHLDIKMYLKENKNKYPILFSLFGVLFSVLPVIGVTYALWTDSAETGNNSISTGTITMRYVEDMSFATINNAEPTTAGNAYQSNNYFPFQVIMNASGSSELDYEVTITTQSTTTYNYDTDQKMRLGLKKENNIVTDGGFTLEGAANNVDYTDGVIVADLPTSGSGVTGNPQTIYKGKISSSGGETIHNFKLYLWLDENAPANSMVETYAIKINVNTGDNNPSYGKYTLTYNNQGGTGCSSKQVRANNPWGELCTPTKTGYEFAGWYSQEQGSGDEVISSTVASRGMTVYAYYYQNSLYDVLRKAARTGTYARTYTGDHQDSMNASLSTETIYYWYGANASAGTAILNKNNVIFANHCWQMIRTTDTGGVRMIYNGEAVDGKCLNTRGTHVGYGGNRTSKVLSSASYYYGTDYTYDSGTQKFSLSGTVSRRSVTTMNGEEVIAALVGKYTCMSVTESGTCSTLYLITGYAGIMDNVNVQASVIPIKSSSSYSQFGTLQFNANYDSPAYVGYMYNTVYSANTFDDYLTEVLFSGSSLSTSYYYANSYDYNVTSTNKYTLTNPYKITSTSQASSLIGKYTLKSTSDTSSSTSAYYIVYADDYMLYTIQLSDGHDLSYYDYTYTYGDSYTDNGNGTYTINNPTTMTRSGCLEDPFFYKYMCKNAVNNTCSDIWYTYPDSSFTGTMHYVRPNNTYKYANSFTYNSSTGKYTLSGNSVTFWSWTENNISSLNNHHYTCFNTSGECTTLSYVYLHSSEKMAYINLEGGKSVNNALEEMLTADDVNTKNSIIKTGVDLWYKKYMLSYDNYIDDTIYCNDRSIKSLNGWNPNGGEVSEYLLFKNNISSSYSSLSCTNVTDKFSVSNQLARLTYKVGLMTSPEQQLLKQTIIRSYYSISPDSFAVTNALVRNVDSAGYENSDILTHAEGVRPVISLISGMGYTSGDGSMANPYVVDTN